MLKYFHLSKSANESHFRVFARTEQLPLAVICGNYITVVGSYCLIIHYYFVACFYFLVLAFYFFLTLIQTGNFHVTAWCSWMHDVLAFQLFICHTIRDHISSLLCRLLFVRTAAALKHMVKTERLPGLSQFSVGVVTSWIAALTLSQALQHFVKFDTMEYLKAQRVAPWLLLRTVDTFVIIFTFSSISEVRLGGWPE